tara:strand:+ start:208 stop:885 length:678 start_codon:yes stop_codon:yes gene_type:complete
MLEGVQEAIYRQRFVMMGTEPDEVRTISGTDPLDTLEPELAKWNVLTLPEFEVSRTAREEQNEEEEDRLEDYREIPLRSCGALGYVGYDCVRYFETRSDESIKKQKDALEIPESVWMFHSLLVAYDFKKSCCHVISLCPIDVMPEMLEKHYTAAAKRVEEIQDRLNQKGTFCLAADFSEKKEAVSNVGADGYKSMVRALKETILGMSLNLATLFLFNFYCFQNHH